MLMKAYNGTFTKKNGDARTMRFIRMTEIPEKFIALQVKGTGRKPTLSEGLELVWDLDTNAFRMFNWKTVEGNVTEIEVDSPFENS
tara:strand:- start:489 stop:746 length:258 start_codon:yes stop_codon:yes gene_type:complete